MRSCPWLLSSHYTPPYIRWLSAFSRSLLGLRHEGVFKETYVQPRLVLVVEELALQRHRITDFPVRPRIRLGDGDIGDHLDRVLGPRMSKSALKFRTWSCIEPL